MFKNFLFVTILIIIIPSNVLSERKMRIAHFLPRTSITHSKFLEPWARKIESEADSEINISIYPDMILGGNPNELIQQVRSGAIDAIWTVIGYTPNQFPKTQLFEIPFINDTNKASIINLALNEFYSLYSKDEFKDFYVVLLHAHTPASINLKYKKIDNLNDIENLKIRVPNPIVGRFIESLNATAIAMPITELYQSLMYNVVDGCLMPAEIIVPLKLHEQMNYYLNDPIYTIVFAFLINKNFYESLPENVRQVIDMNSRSYIANDVGVIWDENEKEMKDYIQKRGGVFYHLNKDELNKVKKIAKKITNQNNNQNLIKEIKRLINKYKK